MSSMVRYTTSRISPTRSHTGSGIGLTPWRSRIGQDQVAGGVVVDQHAGRARPLSGDQRPGDRVLARRPGSRSGGRSAGRTSASADDEVDQLVGDGDDLADRRAVEQRRDLGVGAGRGLERRRLDSPAATVIRARTLPLTCTGTRRCRRPAARGRPRGTAPRPATPAWPSRAHSSSATCGASGASISTSGSATSRGTPPSRVARA